MEVDRLRTILLANAIWGGEVAPALLARLARLILDAEALKL